MLSYENRFKRKGFKIIVGIDEAGRGPLAGPVMAAAVCLKSIKFQSVIKDSKKMTSRQREIAYKEICKKSYFGVGMSQPSIIDKINILNATFSAMTKAVKSLIKQLPASITKDKNFGDKIFLLIDGNTFKANLPFAFETIVKGDSKSLSISCASVIAKVTRDHLMERMDKEYPQYGFRQHKGYATLKHRQQIKKYGLTPIHRKSFTF
ncbi:MAG: ribonuclease HII [Candidatus Aceula meridiana]|nr:ribonuclease HII [Candidatus Aceula meridiana]